MRTIQLTGTDIDTTVIGLGSVGLFRLPAASDRRRMLDAAYDVGIRHFDTAPMYGMGAAESELAPFLRGKRHELTLTTKFGIEPSPLGKVAGRLQRPVRTFLTRRPQLGEGLKAAGRGPSSGGVGRILYVASGYDARSARASLRRSLKALGTDYLDAFLLHDPSVGQISDDLVACLEEQRALGLIRTWGITTEGPDLGEVLARLGGRTPLLQRRDDVFEPLQEIGSRPSATIAFGVLALAARRIRAYLDRVPSERAGWSDRLGVDLGDDLGLPTLLLQEACRRNPDGPVLFSTTRRNRLDVARAAAEGTPRWLAGGAAAFGDLVVAASGVPAERDAQA